jgi:O-antigen ligase
MADPTKKPFFWLGAFFVVYCARPEDWMGPVAYLPLAKITAVLAIWGLFNSLGSTKRTFKDIPQEGRLLLLMLILLFLGGFLSPVWKGGAVSKTFDFSKIYIAWALVFLLITTFERLRTIIFIQSASVIMVCAIALIKGRNAPRLEGVVNGIYSNPNDLAFAIVLSLPFVVAFLVSAKSPIKKLWWLGGMLVMLIALFETASRAGFIDLVIAGGVTLYYFAIKGRRMYLMVAAAFVSILIGVTVGGKLYDRFEALSGDSATDQSAYGSYEQRKFLMKRALDAIEEYPIFGLGVQNFTAYSGAWRDVHMTYLQICSEGGIPVLIVYLMFFRRGFKNLKILRNKTDLDPEIILFAGALTSSLVGFAVGALFAPEAYQYFPYFAVAFTATLMQTVKEQEQEKGSGPAAPPPRKAHHFLEVYADRGRTSAVAPVR